LLHEYRMSCAITKRLIACYMNTECHVPSQNG